MIFQVIAFYLFASLLIGASILVVAARNPVHSVLFLILGFFNAAALFLLMGAEFVALILVIVYVGAVAVLFLFVVMMLEIDFQKLRQGFRRYLGVGLATGCILLVELIYAVWGWTSDPGALGVLPPVSAGDIDNTRALGLVLYTDYVFPFQISGLILLVAMIGAIVLTLRRRTDVRRQRSSQQLDRKIADVLEIRHIQSGQGIDL